VRVAAPCEEDWDEMRGDERVRFCSRCSHNVYNLSAMSRREAERVVLGAEGRLCVRFYRRKDGTILTQNCPTGLIKLKRRVSRLASATAAAALGLFTGIALAPEEVQRSLPETAVTLTPSETVETVTSVAAGPEATADDGEEMGVAEEFTMSEGAMVLDPVSAFAPFLLINGLFFLLTWPLLLLVGRNEEPGGERLRIWNNEWSLSDKKTALHREGSAVEPDG
jgi:hypothetical protein